MRVPLADTVPSGSRALAWVRERYRAVVAAGEPRPPPPDEVKIVIPTVSEFQKIYLRHKKNRRLKAGTEYQREGVLRNWIIPTLGDYRIDEIDLGAIDLIKEPTEEKSSKYVNNVLGIVSSLVRTAKRLRVIRGLPVDTFGMLKVDNSKPPPFYTEEEYGRLVKAALELDVRLGAIVLLGGDAGLRAGEIRALAPFNVKWDQKQIHVERQVWHGVVDTPKSGRGRMVPMTDRLAWTLRRLGRVKGDTLLLDDDGKRFEPKRVRVLVKRAQFNAGLEPTGNAHILHHTFSTTRFVHAWPWRGPPRRSSRHSTGHYRRALRQRSLRRRHWSLAVFGPRPRRMRNPPTNGGLMKREKGFESGLLPVCS
jgi:integrase